MDARRWRRLAAWAARATGAIDVGAGVRGEVVGEVVTLSRPTEAQSPIPARSASPSPSPARPDGWAGGSSPT